MFFAAVHQPYRFMAIKWQSSLFAHDLIGKAVPTPHHVRGRLFSDHARKRGA
jgi:hypothetical protein